MPAHTSSDHVVGCRDPTADRDAAFPCWVPQQARLSLRPGDVNMPPDRAHTSSMHRKYLVYEVRVGCEYLVHEVRVVAPERLGRPLVPGRLRSCFLRRRLQRRQQFRHRPLHLATPEQGKFHPVRRNSFQQRGVHPYSLQGYSASLAMPGRRRVQRRETVPKMERLHIRWRSRYVWPTYGAEIEPT